MLNLRIPKHTFITKENYDTLKNKSNKFYNVINDDKEIIELNSLCMNNITSNLTGMLMFKGSCNNINDLPNSELSNNGDIYLVDNETYVCVDHKWTPIGYEGELYNNETPKMIPISFSNCCNCGAPLHGDAQCNYCGTYNGKYTS